jgi:hypothetical protein
MVPTKVFADLLLLLVTLRSDSLRPGLHHDSLLFMDIGSCGVVHPDRRTQREADFHLEPVAVENMEH